MAHDAVMRKVSGFLASGGTVVLIEPERDVVDAMTLDLAEDMKISIRKRNDVDKGGYDSYVFPVDPSHELWKGIDAEHLKMFNGGYGGEVVSEYDVETSPAATSLAVCGLGLRIPAVMELKAGRGRIVISRLQIRGRLLEKPSGKFFDRRMDPVLQQYIINLITTYGR
jgi:hypothetical protein